MKKGLIIILAIVVLIVILVATLTGKYNSFVSLEEAVEGQWGNVENVYQRRGDLIPNLVATVKGYAAHERETLEAVIEARAKATSIQAQITPETLGDPNLLQQFQAAQGQLGAALGRLMVVIERYPDLKANQNFLTLQSQLEGTENRIAVARKDYIEAVRQYNTEMKTIPGRWWHSWLYPEYEPMPNFSAPEATQAPAPQVQF